MNSNISRISEVMEDIKQKITDNEYKMIMDSLMEINKITKLKLLNQNQERNKFVCLFNWLDTKLEITEYKMIVLGEGIYKHM